MSLPREFAFKRIVALCFFGYFLVSLVAMISASCRRLRDSESMLFNLAAFSVMAFFFPIAVHFVFSVDMKRLAKAFDSYNFNLELSGQSPFYLYADFGIRMMYFVLPMGYCLYCLCKKSTKNEAAATETSKPQQALLKNAA